jgi:hypothetical protein
MLANLAVRDFDGLVQRIAYHHGMIYTRYADDLSLSTSDRTFNRERCQAVIGEVYHAMGQYGLSPNLTKTRIVSPGARKIVLGLLVSEAQPRLTRDFKAKMRQHIYYLRRSDSGPAEHALKRGFSSIRGMKHHIFGLAAFARQIEPDYGSRCLEELRRVEWPL